MAPNNLYTEPSYRYDLRPSKHRLGRIEASSVRNKSDFFLSMGLQSTDNTSVDWLDIMDIGCRNCQHLICKCKSEEKKTTGIHRSQWEIFTKKCSVVIIGKKCTVCKKNFKCETDLQRHCIRRHRKKQKNSQILLILKIGDEKIAELFLDRKYLLIPDRPKTRTIKSPNLPGSTAEDCVKQVNWPSLRIYKVEAYKDYSKNSPCGCSQKPTVTSHDKNNNDNSLTQDEPENHLLGDFLHPIGSNNVDFAQDAEVEEILRVTKALPKFPGLSVSCETFYDLANQLNEDATLDGSEIKIKPEPPDTPSDNVSQRNSDTPILETTCDNNLDLPERNYTFHVSVDSVGLSQSHQKKTINVKQQKPSVAPPRDARSALVATHNFYNPRDLLPEEGPMINWDDYLLSNSAGEINRQGNIIIKTELDLHTESDTLHNNVIQNDVPGLTVQHKLTDLEEPSRGQVLYIMCTLV